jgi:hypothetical protein
VALNLIDKYFIGKIMLSPDNTNLACPIALAFESHTIYSHSISSLLLLIDYEQVQYHRMFD